MAPKDETMTLTDTQARLCAEFREWLYAKLADDDRFGVDDDDDHQDGSTLTTRWSISDELCIQVSLRPLIPQVRVGVVTDDRWKSEEIEQAVQDSGDTMEEFLELGFEDAGLDWDEPPVEHYRDKGKWFSFITPLELDRLEMLADDATRNKVLKMIDGYCRSYGEM